MMIGCVNGFIIRRVQGMMMISYNKTFFYLKIILSGLHFKLLMN